MFLVWGEGLFSSVVREHSLQSSCFKKNYYLACWWGQMKENLWNDKAPDEWKDFDNFLDTDNPNQAEFPMIDDTVNLLSIPHDAANDEFWDCLMRYLMENPHDWCRHYCFSIYYSYSDSSFAIIATLVVIMFLVVFDYLLQSAKMAPMKGVPCPLDWLNLTKICGFSPTLCLTVKALKSASTLDHGKIVVWSCIVISHLELMFLAYCVFHLFAKCSHWTPAALMIPHIFSKNCIFCVLLLSLSWYFT